MNDKHLFAQTAGFTLTELLTVVIIVGLLAALATGYYKRSVEQTRFSEGLTAASTIIEGLNQAYYEDVSQGVAPGTANNRRKIKALPVKIANGQECTGLEKDYCVATKYFEIAIVAPGKYVKAYRGTKSNYRYYLELRVNYFPTDAYGNYPGQIACVADSTVTGFDAKAFCESMGYTKCDNTTKKCKKP